MLKNTVRAGIYTAPAILSFSAIAPVGAAAPSSPPTATPTSVPTPLPTPTPIPFPVTLTFGQDALLTNTGAGASFDVYYTLSNQPAMMLTFLGTITTDRFGFGGGVFPLTVDARFVASVTLTYILHGNPPTSPPAATSTSTLIAALNPVNNMRQPVTFVGLVIQKPTAAACQMAPASPTQFTEYVDVAILNATPNTSYTISVQSNRHTAPVVVTTATTNADGNVTVFAGVVTPVVVVAPTSVVVTAVPTGGGAPLTLTASGATLTTIPCSAFTAATTAIRAIRAIGIARP